MCEFRLEISLSWNITRYSWHVDVWQCLKGFVRIAQRIILKEGLLLFRTCDANECINGIVFLFCCIYTYTECCKCNKKEIQYHLYIHLYHVLGTTTSLLRGHSFGRCAQSLPSIVKYLHVTCIVWYFMRMIPPNKIRTQDRGPVGPNCSIFTIDVIRSMLNVDGRPLFCFDLDDRLSSTSKRTTGVTYFMVGSTSRTPDNLGAILVDKGCTSARMWSMLLAAAVWSRLHGPQPPPRWRAGDNDTQGQKITSDCSTTIFTLAMVYVLCVPCNRPHTTASTTSFVCRSMTSVMNATALKGDTRK